MTCINTSPNGDVSFIAKGTTPFEGIQYINFYVKSFSGGGYASNKEGEVRRCCLYRSILFDWLRHLAFVLLAMHVGNAHCDAHNGSLCDEHHAVRLITALQRFASNILRQQYTF